MLLRPRARIASGRNAALIRAAAMAAALLLPPLLLAACTIAHDDAYVPRGRPTGGRGTALAAARNADRDGCDVDDGDAVVDAPRSVPQSSRSFLGFRRDPVPDRKREVRAGWMSSDPREKPSYREQREARAMALAQAELLSQGGGIRYRSDGSSSEPNQVEYVASKGALTIEYLASDQLNRADDLPHALVLVVYHMTNRAALDQLARTEDGIGRLLEGKPFDNTVLSVEQHYIQPGTGGVLTVNRPADGRYVALVAGYATPEARTSVFVTEYGVGRYVKDGKALLDKRYYMFMPLPLNLAASLGDTEMWVKDTGLIYGDMRRVTNLLWRQQRYFATDGSFLANVAKVME